MSWFSEFLSGFGGRKLIINSAGLIAACALLVAGLITADHWVTALGITVGGYTLAEGAADAIGRAKGEGK